MPLLHALVLGLVQGLTEFLPISSSGHLVLVPWLAGWNDLGDPRVEQAFDVALHLGTLVAVVGYFHRDLRSILHSMLTSVTDRVRGRGTREHGEVLVARRLGWLLIVSALPAGIVGVLAGDWISRRLGTPGMVAVSLVVFGVVLAVADRRRGGSTLAELGWGPALAIGCAQVLALNPGTSRSGITIAAALALGFRRDDAARFAFLMSLPVVAGAVVLEVGGLALDGIPEGLVLPMILGVLAAGTSGLVAVWGTLRFVRSRSFAPFVAYRVLTAGVVGLVMVAGWR